MEALEAKSINKILQAYGVHPDSELGKWYSDFMACMSRCISKGATITEMESEIKKCRARHNIGESEIKNFMGQMGRDIGVTGNSFRQQFAYFHNNPERTANELIHNVCEKLDLSRVKAHVKARVNGFALEDPV